MALPDLDSRGLLPDGIHDANLQQIEDRFCVNKHRELLWGRAALFLIELRDRVGGGELVFAGSFFSDKPDPEDIEATVVTGADSTLIGRAFTYALERMRIKQQFSVDFYPTLPGDNDFVDFFRYVGPKTARAKNLGLRDRRGVVRVLQWAHG